MHLDEADLSAIADAVVERLAREHRAERLLPDGQLGYTEEQAATVLGVPRHSLRDCRLRGEITARRLGKRYLYSRQTLLSFLNDHN